MKRRISMLISMVVLIMLLASACNLPLSAFQGSQPTPGGNPLVKYTPTSAATPTPAIEGVWISPSVPHPITGALSGTDIQPAADLSTAAFVLREEVAGSDSGSVVAESNWVYALVAPFLTVMDGVTTDQLKQIWLGSATDNLAGIQLQVNDATLATFTEKWGTPSQTSVKMVTDAEMAVSDTTWAIVPFGELLPKYKVLKIDGLSPLDKPLAIDKYALDIKYGLFENSGADPTALTVAEELKAKMPTTNRDESRMTVLIMSGTTALTRATAFKIDTRGTDYVISGVKDWFMAADLRHVSNEVSFNPDCPKADPNSTSMRFCSSPAYIDVLKGLGINVVELTGNHENDYGADAFAQTIQTYKDLGWTIYGGGVTPDDARKPALVESNGNKIAFIGCNPVGPANDWVSNTQAGVAKCDPDYYYPQISVLKQQGYVVIATFQHQEVYQYMYDDYYKTDFRKAADSGADIVSGAQAHYPMGFELRGNTLIHYGMGNFLFDQMDYPVVGTRREFIDRHIIYDGKYINTELLSALLTDYSRPRPMTIEERTQFLTDLFTASK